MTAKLISRSVRNLIVPAVQSASVNTLTTPVLRLSLNRLPRMITIYSSAGDEKNTRVKWQKRSGKDRKPKDKAKGKSRRDKHSNKKLKEKGQDERNGSPVQLSKKPFLGRDKEDGVRRSSVSGKKILLKVDKTKEDKQAENNRSELLKFLNASCD